MIGIGLSPVTVAVQKRFAAADPAPTWDSGNKSASLTLSNGALTASGINANTYGGITSTNSHSAGKKTFRVLLVSGDEIYAGLATGTYDPTENRELGGTDQAWSFCNYGFEFHNNEQGNSGLDDVTAGEYIWVAVDFDAGKIWYGTSGGGWLGSPDAGTGNAYHTFVPNTTLFAAAAGYIPGAGSVSLTADFTATNGLSTFAAWDS